MKLTVLKNHVPLNEVLLDTPDLNERYEIFAGRSEDCHLLIDDPLISRHHFVLRNDGAQWFCEKLSNLGTVMVNGRTDGAIPLRNGDEIKCGLYSVILSGIAQGEPVPAERAATVAAPAAYAEPREDYSTRVMRAEQKPKPEVVAPAEPPDELLSDLSLDGPTEPPLSEAEVADPESPQETFGEEDFEARNDDSVTVENSDSDTYPTDSEEAPAEYPDNGLTSVSDFADEGAVVEQDEKTRFDTFFVNYQLMLFGEHAPYDRYLIEGEETFIGRDEKKCQIILNDPEVSSVHAVIRKTRIDLILEDLNSSNGTILNGERINKAHISPGDEFVIGGTSFALEVKSDLLSSEKDRLMPVEQGQVIEKEEILEEEVTSANGDISFDSAPEEKSIIKRILKDPVKRKKAVYAIAALGIMFVILYEPDETDTANKVNTPAPKATTAPVKTAKVKLSAELENQRNVSYEIGVSLFEQNKYSEALREFKIVAEIDPTYKKIQTYLEQTEIGLKRLEELEKQKRAEEERIKTKKLIEELMVKAREAVKDHNVTVAESFFSQIAEKDPENIEIQQLRLELESWQKEEQRKALEKAAAEAKRKSMVDALSPGKTFYLKKEWYRATLKLEEFLRKQGMDEDLIKDASNMLSDAKNQLASELGPLLGKARSQKEGQDLKSAYESFLEVLKLEPTNAEALNEVDDIRSSLESRSKKIYREAIIAESLSLFSDAKEKFQEVQQISPTDSEYYKKASDKLKNYLE